MRARVSVSALAIAATAWVAPVAPAPPDPAVSKGSAYRIALAPDRSVTISNNGVSHRFAPRFVVLVRDGDPKLALTRAHPDPGERKRAEDPEAYPAPSWTRADGAGRTDDLFQAARAITLEAVSAEQRRDAIVWRFGDRPEFALEASVVPGEAEPQPVIRFRLTPKRAGWFSVVYAGAPTADPHRVDALLQPLVWQEKRFPRAPIVSAEFMTSLPATFVTSGGATLGLAADPAESPFRLPVFENSRFGVLLRNAAGEAQPMIAAPLLGQPDSRLEPGRSFSFAMRPVIVRGSLYQAFQATARDLFGFRDRRENAELSLNDTIDNMVDFAMDDRYSGWVEALKGFDYRADVAGAVKVVSALHPLSMALVRDDPEIFHRRALPVAEYLLSREKYLFSSLPGVTIQGASHRLAGPSAEVSELSALHAMSGGRSTVFADYARLLASRPRTLNLSMVSDPETFQNHLALYRMEHRPAELARARALADAYLARRVDRTQTDFADVRIPQGGQFWTDFAPAWIDLFELWQETGERRYLDGAVAGARLYATYCWYFPRVPDGAVTVDASGGAPVSWIESVSKVPILTPPRTLPAWRVSQIGLTPEASTTYQANPAVMLAPYAAYFLRVAGASDDPFLRAVARWAVVGRYANYPGYDINGAFSDVYARADYPLRPYEQFSYNQVYYNHVWPHVALLTDYLVSDAEVRSGGRIAFPSRYAQGYAYLKSKVYGDRPGRFMDDEAVRLWMPEGLVAGKDPALNHLAGHGNGRVYLALFNESDRTVDSPLRLNGQLALWQPGRSYRYRLWRDGRPAAPGTLTDGRTSVTVPPRGYVAMAIDDLPVFTRFQQDAGLAGPPLGPRSHAVARTPFGEVTGMLLSFGRGLGSAYVWLQADERQAREARLVIEGRAPIVDRSYPYDFSLPVADSVAELRYHVEVVRPDGVVTRGPDQRLAR